MFEKFLGKQLHMNPSNLSPGGEMEVKTGPGRSMIFRKTQDGDIKVYNVTHGAEGSKIETLNSAASLEYSLLTLPTDFDGKE